MVTGPRPELRRRTWRSGSRADTETFGASASPRLHRREPAGIGEPQRALQIGMDRIAERLPCDQRPDSRGDLEAFAGEARREERAGTAGNAPDQRSPVGGEEVGE